MALYVPAGSRRRRLALVAAAGLLVGLLAGFALGRSTAETVADRIEAVQDKAAAAATALERIPIEYEQALAGSGGESVATVSEAVDRARAQLAEVYAKAPWLGPQARAEPDAAVDAVGRAVTDRVPLAELEALIAEAVAAIQNL